MKRTCIFCNTIPEAGDLYCADCGRELHAVRYGTLEEARPTDRVIRMSRRSAGMKAAMGTVWKVLPDQTVMVTWPHLRESQRIKADKLCLTFRTDEEGKLIW